MKPVIRPLVGIRGVFAAMVMAFHCGVVFPGNLLTSPDLFKNGYLGVDGFFILSGFIMAYVHGDEMVTPTVRAVRQFFAARFARIYPLHILTLCVLALSLLLGAILGFSPHLPERYSLASAVANLLLIHAWIGMSMSWDTTSWTLSCEFAAYLIFPLLAFVAGRASKLFAVAALVAFVAGVWVLRTDQLATVWKIYPEFVLGMALYRLRGLIGVVADRVAFLASLGAGVSIVAGLAPLAITCMALMIFALRDASGRFSAWLGSRPMRYLGDISYAFYLWQGVTLLLVKHASDLLFAQRSAGPAAASLETVVAVFGTFAVAAVSHASFEVPARAFVRRRLTAWRCAIWEPQLDATPP